MSSRAARVVPDTFLAGLFWGKPTGVMRPRSGVGSPVLDIDGPRVQGLDCEAMPGPEVQES